MPDFYTPQLDPQHPARHLCRLETPFGARTVYDSVSYCNRCGSCQQACPTYLLTSQETFSPRGRNQLVRLAAEGKLNLTRNRRQAEETLNSCLLCGRCTQACAGKIPTAEHMLELRRTLRTQALPALLFKLLSWRGTRPAAFRRLVHTGLWLRRLGLLRFARGCGFTRLPGLSWLNHADDILPAFPPAAQRRALHQAFANTPAEPTLIYLPSLEAEFFLPQLALSVVQLASQKKHQTLLWPNTSSGLFEYVYGDLRQSRRWVRRLILRHASLHKGKLPVVTDSVDVYLFLRRAPQLFAARPYWQNKAQAFADRVLFVTDLFPPKLSPAGASARVRLDCGALFSREGKPFEEARKILKTHFKKNFVECLYKDAGTPAFGYSFVRGNLGEKICMSAVRSIARTQTGTVFTLSGLAALELNFQLKRFYPQAKADHLARLNG